MKNYKNILLLLLAFVTVLSCEYEKAKTEAEDPGSLDNKAMVSVSPSLASGSEVTEGSIVDFEISFDKPVNLPVEMVAVLKGGTASEDDIALSSATVMAYGTSATLSVEIPDDLIPENDETAIITLESGSPASDYFVHPNSNIPEFTYTIKSAVDPDDLIVALEWDLEKSHDLDMFAFLDFGGTIYDWDNAATGDYPESKNLVWGVDPDGTYYIGIDPYDVEDGVTEFDYKFSLGQPDGTVTVIEGSFDYENRDTVYATDVWDAWGTTVYLLVQVEKTGTTFVATGL